MKFYRIAFLAAIMAIVWAAFSGMSEAFFIFVAIAAITIAILLSHLTTGIDDESFPVEIAARMPVFAVKLFTAMLQSSLRVIRLSLSQNPTIKPEFVELSGIGTPVADVIYANSITLTPGTVTVRFDETAGASIIVHALEGGKAESFLPLEKITRELTAR